MTDQPDTLFEDDPILGAYVSHHPSNRFWLLVQAGFIYSVPVILLNLVFVNVTTLGALALISTFAVWALVVGWGVMHRWNREVIVYERGFTYQQGSRVIYIHFAEITRFRQHAERIVYLGRFRRERYRYDMTTRKGETLRLTNLYQRAARLGVLLEKGIVHSRLPIIQAQLAAGETVPFGADLVASQAGLSAGTRHLPWGQVRGQRVENGQIIFTSAESDAALSLPLDAVDNPLLLLALVRSYRQPATSDPAAVPLASSVNTHKKRLNEL